MQPTWLVSIESSQRAQYASQFDALVKHLSESIDFPDKPFKQTALGRTVSESFDRRKLVALVEALLLAVHACGEVRDEGARDLLLTTLATVLRRNIPLADTHVDSLLLTRPRATPGRLTRRF
jgi:hypothetical protein